MATQATLTSAEQCLEVICENNNKDTSFYYIKQYKTE